MPGVTAKRSAGTLVYDGDCGFCAAAARWAQRRLKDGCQAVPWQEIDLEAVNLTSDQISRSAWWITSDGIHHEEHAAIAVALQAMNQPWPTFGRFLILPPVSPLARSIYRLLARNRHRLPPFKRAKKCGL